MQENTAIAHSAANFVSSKRVSYATANVATVGVGEADSSLKKKQEEIEHGYYAGAAWTFPCCTVSLSGPLAR